MAKRRRFTPDFKAEVVIEALSGQSSQAELCRKHNLSADQLSKWKHQLVDNASTLFESTDKQSNDHNEQIAQLEQLVGLLTLALDIRKKSLDLAQLNRSQKQQMIEALQTDYSVRQICDALGLHRSSLYYQSKTDPSEQQLRKQIEQLAACYPTYGYRHITQLLSAYGIYRWLQPGRTIDERTKSFNYHQACVSNHPIGCGFGSMGQSD